MTRVRAAIAAAIIAGIGFGSAARADDVPAAVDDVEIADLFSSFCLQSFPDQAALDRLARSKAATAMKAEEVKAYLHADPGRGWYLRTPLARYAITIESPPYRACAVRRMTPSGVFTVQHYIDAVKAYAAAKTEKLVNMPPQKTTTPEGLDISAYPFAVLDAAGKATETFMLILTNYHGRVAEPLRAEAGSGVGVEVRMVHQLPPH